MQAGLCFLLLLLCKPFAFHNKSQIINKYMPVMSRLFNRRNWKMRRQVIISVLPKLGSVSPSPSLPSCLSSISATRLGSDPASQQGCHIAPPHPGLAWPELGWGATSTDPCSTSRRAALDGEKGQSLSQRTFSWLCLRSPRAVGAKVSFPSPGRRHHVL